MKTRQVIKHLCIIVVALAAFYLLIGVKFKEWAMYQYIGAAMVAVIIVISIINAIRAVMDNKYGGEEQMPKIPKKGQQMPAASQSSEFGFRWGEQAASSEKDPVLNIKRKIDGLTGFLKIGTDELKKQYLEISRMEVDINSKAKELYEQWMRLKGMKQIVGDMLQAQQMKKQQELPKQE